MINKLSLEFFFKKLLKVAENNHDEFNSIDGQLGDGDLGITISKGLSEINNNFDKFEDDLGKIFMVCAQSFTKASSSSFGTLVAISFMTVSKETKGTNELAIKNLPVIIKKIIDAVCSRGKSKIGDKTFVDTLCEIAKSIEENNTNFGQNVHEATLKALKDFNGKECKIGRARMFAEKSKNLNDPGMFALSKLSSVLLAQ
jgi:dihydroxyacetone kinase-like protein